jgi:hypothetical protein
MHLAALASRMVRRPPNRQPTTLWPRAQANSVSLRMFWPGWSVVVHLMLIAIPPAVCLPASAWSGGATPSPSLLGQLTAGKHIGTVALAPNRIEPQLAGWGLAQETSPGFPRVGSGLNTWAPRPVETIGAPMKRTVLLGWGLGLLLGALPTTASSQAVLVFGAVNSGGSAPAQVNGCNGGYCSGCGQPLAYATQPVRYRTPDIIYVGAARGYPQPNYFSGWGYGPAWANHWAPNVIPFGLGQAYVHGYLFRHCR